MACRGRNSFTPTILNRSFRWRWVVRFIMVQPLFHQTKNSWYPLNMRLGWPLNQSECFVEVKNLLNLQGIWPWFSGPYPVHYYPHSYQCSTYVFLRLLNRSACSKEPEKILSAAAEQKGSQVNCFFKCHHPVQIPLLPPIIHRAQYYDEGGWEMPKVYTETDMESNRSETEMFKIK